jgi:hypothetical protein
MRLRKRFEVRSSLGGHVSLATAAPPEPTRPIIRASLVLSASRIIRFRCNLPDCWRSPRNADPRRALSVLNLRCVRTVRRTLYFLVMGRESTVPVERPSTRFEWGDLPCFSYHVSVTAAAWVKLEWLVGHFASSRDGVCAGLQAGSRAGSDERTRTVVHR